MDGNKNSYYSTKDVISFMQSFIRYFFKKWKIFGLVIITAIAVAITYYFTQSRKYVAECTFILEEKQSGMSGLGGIASQFGFDIGGLGSGGSIFAGDNILDILKSKKIVYKVLLSGAASDSINNQTLADYFLDFSGWKKKWEKNPNLNSIGYRGLKSQADLSLRQDSVLNLIHRYLLQKYLTVDRQSKKGSIIRVQLTSPDSYFSRILAERLVEETTKLYLDIKTGTAQANINQMQKRADSLLYLLNNKSFAVAASQQLDVNPALRTAVVPVEIGTRDKTVLATLYSEVVKNLEASKLLLTQQTPAIQVLDRPDMLPKDQKFGLIKLNVLFVLGFAFLYVFILFMAFFISRNL